MLVPAAHPPAPPPPARVLVFATEFRFSSSRGSVPAGPLRLQVRNIGEDDHDLRIVGPGRIVRARTGVVGPGGLGEIRIRLPRGRYTLVCGIADHAARGMRARLTAIPPRGGVRG